MKKYSLLIVALLFIVSQYSISAQDIIMVESDMMDDNMVNIAPIKLDDGYLSLVVKYENRSWEDPKMNPKSILNKNFNYEYISDEDQVYLSKVDNDLNVVAQNKIKFKDAHDVNIYGMFHYDGKTSLYYTQRKNFSNEVQFYCMDIDNAKLKRNKTRKIYTLKHKNGIPATRMIVSPDSTKIAFLSEKYFGNKDERKIYVALFNIQGTPIWNDPVYLGADTERLTIGDAALDNDGNIFISYKLYDKYSNDWSKKDKNGDKIPAFKTRIITYGIDETEAFVTINDQDKFIRRCDLIYNPIKEKVQAVGTYSIKDGGNLTGVYTLDLDPIKMTSETTQFHKFDTKLISLFDKDGIGQTKEKDPGIEIRDVETKIHIKENGDLVYVMQPYRFNERFINNGLRTNTVQNIESGFTIYSMVVAQLQNNTATFTRIPRRSRGLESFGELIGKSLVYNDQVYVIYTDYHKNIEREDFEKPKTMGDAMRSSLILTNIDSEGNYYRSFLKNRDQEARFNLSMDDVQFINDRELMYTFYGGGLFSSKRQIGVISF